MIFTGFKRKSNQIFFNRRLKDLLKKSTAISSKEIKRVIVFLDTISEKDKVKKEILALFNIAEKDLKMVVFQQKVSKEESSEDIITPKDFGWYGRINSEKLKTILTKKYDLLINYSKVDNLYSNLLLLQCKIGFRAGFKHLDNRFYDLLIDCKSDDFKLFDKELLKYLKILKKI
ncbi:hypothetical protein [uncultured Lutibacter sp.]|uniref:DUF6913 domain-containing protein n=1 Tax=uncultured Lutibacter sp. TaxID=437739 RepID=UPI002620023B|nr:hypothetical protein [uncultured Lutibacter sp.]